MLEKNFSILFNFVSKIKVFVKYIYALRMVSSLKYFNKNIMFLEWFRFKIF